MSELDVAQMKPYRIHLIDEGGQGWIYNTVASSPEEALTEYRQKAGDKAKRVDWIQDVEADRALNQTAAEDIDWRTELAEGTYETQGEFDIDPANIGVWVDKGTPDIGYRIQQYAKRYGWNGNIIEDAQAEDYYEATQNAQKFLSDKAPAGYHFGNDEEGNWGMWEGTNTTLAQPETNTQEKEVMEMTDEDFDKALAPETPAAEVQAEGTKTTAAIDPNKLQWSKEGTDAVSKDETGNVVSKVPWTEFEQKSPEIAGKVTTASILEEVTILSEFCDELHPVVASVIDNGTEVFIKPLNVFGTVVRCLDDSAFRVEANEKVATYFREELEVRQTSE